MEILAEMEVDPARGRIHEEGWQSWTTTTTYPLDARPGRDEGRNRLMLEHGDWAPADAFQGAGLLAVDPGDGSPIHVFAAADGLHKVPNIRADRSGTRLAVRSNGPTEHLVDPGPGGIDGALARWADLLVARNHLPDPRPAPTTWCTWYQYFTEVSEADVDENLEAMDGLDLPIDVVQVDDGYQAEIGDWLTASSRFRSIEAMAQRTRARGRRAGIWIAPFLVGARSELARRHSDWLVREGDDPIDAGRNWDQDLAVLDVTHPDASAYLADVLSTMCSWGFDFFKIDFVYAGALQGRRHVEMDGIAAYRLGLELIRRAIGDAYLLGCGAPVLPSIGLVDAMRVSGDTAPTYDPGSRAAIVSGAARAYQHGRFWVTDPDCLIVRPEVERREEWAEHVDRYGGLRSSSDRLRLLDAWGLATTRRLLTMRPPRHFVPSNGLT